MSLTISKDTESKAYKFIKALIRDGADGADIHNLVIAISLNLGQEVGGKILMDLLSNPADAEGDVEHHSTWFGPIDHTCFKIVINGWAEYCEARDINGSFRFGDTKDWDSWRSHRSKNGSDPLSDSQFAKISDLAKSQLCVFEWSSDRVIAKDAFDFIEKLYKTVNDLSGKQNG